MRVNHCLGIVRVLNVRMEGREGREEKEKGQLT